MLRIDFTSNLRLSFVDKMHSSRLLGLLVVYAACAASRSPCHMNPQVAPPVPIVSLSDVYMTNQSVILPRSFNDVQDAGPIQCGPGQPCTDKSCCNSSGKCGYGLEHCSQSAPASCVSNCDAKAMCGRDSSKGAIKCGENLCCSHYGWCGTTENHCINSDPKGNTAPCQKGFGDCKIVPPPSCGPESGTATNGRKIGYYNAANPSTRLCNKVLPGQIITSDYTHLYFAFASIDPKTFAIVQANPEDDKLYKEFTALKTANLQTWIAIGGFDFSDNGTSTHTTWSDMCSSSTSRGQFISSLVSFMDQYGFSGCDLDWEYPVAPERGGREDDTANMVLLLQELRAAVGSKYGISVAL
jgi:chitinase